MADEIRVRSVNWHLTTRCNYNCKFCFSRNLDTEIKDFGCAKEILEELRALEIEKINFVGGEPLLHPLIFDIVKLAKSMGFVVSIVSNGYYLNRAIIFELSPFVDWIGLSVDSAHEEVEMELGRGNGSHVRKILELAEIVHEVGIKLKINTTVTKLNWMEDMRPLLRRLKPHRWKVFQVLHIGGQNDLCFDELSITDEQFNHFKSLNNGSIDGIIPIFEGNHQMVDSYFMLSPGGMIMSNRDGTNRTFSQLARINHENITQVLDLQQYVDRGGIYSW
jgi:radical S-adenosyl methionine domain-containing protein 2